MAEVHKNVLRSASAGPLFYPVRYSAIISVVRCKWIRGQEEWTRPPVMRKDVFCYYPLTLPAM
jgi:hypothetical protein